ncbi:hypothetical protein [Sphingomonas sp.]|uniref:hypothetical protein n=1 Tax=Sphingomonas sp. TaxID=28214 RepID=UPI0035C82074
MTGPGWPDARGWVGVGSFVLTVVVLGMLAFVPELRKDEFFKTIATLIIGTGFVNGVVNWAYGATKGGGDLADNNAAIIRKQAENSPPIEKDATR